MCSRAPLMMCLLVKLNVSNFMQIPCAEDTIEFRKQNNQRHPCCSVLWSVIGMPVCLLQAPLQDCIDYYKLTQCLNCRGKGYGGGGSPSYFLDPPNAVPDFCMGGKYIHTAYVRFTSHFGQTLTAKKTQPPPSYFSTLQTLTIRDPSITVTCMSATLK